MWPSGWCSAPLLASWPSTAAWRRAPRRSPGPPPTDAGASLYAVDQPADLRWHVSSTLVDPSASLAARAGSSAHVDAVVALHGYGRPDRPGHVLVGGANRTLAAAVAATLRIHLAASAWRSSTTSSAIPVRLRGVHPSNPVNRIPGGGVQLELPVRTAAHRPGEVAARAGRACAARACGPARADRQGDRRSVRGPLASTQVTDTWSLGWWLRSAVVRVGGRADGGAVDAGDGVAADDAGLVRRRAGDHVWPPAHRDGRRPGSPGSRVPRRRSR